MQVVTSASIATTTTSASSGVVIRRRVMIVVHAAVPLMEVASLVCRLAIGQLMVVRSGLPTVSPLDVDDHIKLIRIEVYHILYVLLLLWLFIL